MYLCYMYVFTCACNVLLPLYPILQGLNFSGADLSKLDLRFVNFKYANLSCANLAGANLSNVNFERAEMTESILDVSATNYKPVLRLRNPGAHFCDFVLNNFTFVHHLNVVTS